MLEMVGRWGGLGQSPSMMQVVYVKIIVTAIAVPTTSAAVGTPTDTSAVGRFVSNTGTDAFMQPFTTFVADEPPFVYSGVKK